MANGTATLALARYFTKQGVHPYDAIEWVKRDAQIMSPSGEVVFEQQGVEFPKDWSQNAINIVAQKYFWGTPGTKERETSLRHLVDRVADTITKHGYDHGYFLDETEADVFNEELKAILANQYAAFNSPVWFNIGAPGRPQQASACFILQVEDNLPSILNWFREEGMIFKGGSGAGLNISSLRSSYEKLSGSGGKSSGPVSFMRGADSVAGMIKSGGKTRRAAKMVILNIDHPDVEEFIWCKAREERKSHALQELGFEMGLNGKDSISIQYQNANNSVRVTDDFMRAVENNEMWDLVGVNEKKVFKTVKARDLWRQIAQASWECADPGLQYDTTINDWHTTPNAGRIYGSNPCSEYMHLNNSACNLSSINLLKYRRDDGGFDIAGYKHTIEVMTLAQEILVGYSEYPTEAIAKTAKAYRQLGLGYANLGALLMAESLPYDSDEGRALAAALTAVMTGHSYATSAKIAKRVGTFEGYEKDKDGVNRVLRKHREAVNGINAAMVSEELLRAAADSWDEAVELGQKHGVRNAQATLLAPTGTIAFMMDCATTGIEPDFALVKYKTLVGGGSMVIINDTVPMALRNLGYDQKQIEEITAYVLEKSSVKDAPHLKPEHYAIFACAVGDNAIHYNGHVDMMAAVQPFLSGAISKTVNMPEDVTVEDVEQLHMDAWKKGLKAIAIYRDNCKAWQPLSADKKKQLGDKTKTEAAEDQSVVVAGPLKRELPRTRTGRTYEFHVADTKGFFTVGLYDDGKPGELFINVAKQGSTLGGIMDSFAISVSHGLQYGVPLKSYVKSMRSMSYAPAGMTDDPEIQVATSLTDYIFRRLALDYLSFDDRVELGLASFDEAEVQENQASLLSEQPAQSEEQEAKAQTEPQPQAQEQKVTGSKKGGAEAAPLCAACGNTTQRAGSCYVCTVCGSTSGCS
jgi:ribonucleoside-diphosphate reductase alpha chain